MMTKEREKDLLLRKHMSWCFANNVRIYIQPLNQVTGKIVIEHDGEITYSEETYKLDNTLMRKKRLKGDPPKMIYSDKINELYTLKYIEKHGTK